MFKLSKINLKVKAIKITRTNTSMYAYLRDIKREGEVERDYTSIYLVGRGVVMTSCRLGLFKYCVCMLIVFLRVRNIVWRE